MTRKNLVYIEEPSVQSRAALVLLKFQLSEAEREEWLSFRNAFLDERGLVCEYCGKAGLTKEVVPGLGHFFLATVDHVIPVSKGGAVYDKDNLKVACYPCNKSKKDTLLEDWYSKAVHYS